MLAIGQRGDFGPIGAFGLGAGVDAATIDGGLEVGTLFVGERASSRRSTPGLAR